MRGGVLLHEGGIMDYKEELIKTLGKINLERNDTISEDECIIIFLLKN